MRHPYKDLSLQQLRGFCAICRLGSYAGAARQLGLSPSTVWEQMRGLERQFEVPLLETRDGTVQPTPEGRRLLELALPLLAGLESTREVLRQQRGRPPESITIVSGMRMLMEEIGQAIPIFRRRYPDVRLRLLYVEDREIDSLVEQGKADLGLILEPGPGRPLRQEGAVPDAVPLLLDGQVVERRGAEPARELVAPAALGFREALEGRPSSATVATAGPAVTLSIGADDMRLLLADNTDLIDGLFRTLVSHDLAPVEAPVILSGRAAEAVEPGLSPVQKVLALQSLPLFAHATGDEMLHLAAAARETRLAAGEALAASGDRPAIFFVLSGELVLEAPRDPVDPNAAAGPMVAGPGDAVGVHETLAGVAFGRTVRATRDGLALRLDRADFLDLLGQRPALLQQVFRALFDLLPAAAAAA